MSETEFNIIVATFYHFTELSGCEALRDRLRAQMRSLDVRGVVLIATEGINGTIAGRREGVDRVLETIRAVPPLRAIKVKESRCERIPFRRPRVKVKPEIVTLRRPEADPRRQVGAYVEPEAWNDLVDDPEVVLIDTRNEYEVRLGTFDGAIDPDTRYFTEFPDFVARNLDPRKHRKVAMFCTGGIRCEKATAFMLEAGFEEVYHLKGGILKYLETIPREQSRWVGDCFVFDRRVAVDHNLAPAPWPLCARCGQPWRPDEGACPSCLRERQRSD